MVDVAWAKRLAKGVGGRIGQLHAVDLVLNIGVVAAEKRLPEGAGHGTGRGGGQQFGEANFAALGKLLNLLLANVRVAD